MTICLLTPSDSSWVFKTTDFPCTCCDAPRAMDHMDGYWHCDQQKKTWLVLDEFFSSIDEHSVEQCVGDCIYHPLVDPLIFSLSHSDAFNICWGDLIIIENTSDSESSMPQIDDNIRYLSIKASEMERYARLKQQMNTEVVKSERGKIYRIRKISEPCKWLYLDEKAPKCDWRRTRDGKMEPPYRRYLTGAECWAFEYHDPKTNILVKKHTCDHLHPGEEGWCSEWAKDSKWRPSTELRDFSGLSKRTSSYSSDSISVSSGVSSSASILSRNSANNSTGRSLRINKMNTFKVLDIDSD